MRDLFVSHGQDPNTPSNEVDTVLATLRPTYADSIPHLKAYAEQLLATGRNWLGQPRAAMSKPVIVTCAGLPLEVSPHRVTKSPDGKVITLEFVRNKPPAKWSRQHQILRWILKYLTERYRDYSFTGSLFVLSTGEAHSVAAYGRLPDDFVLVSVARRLMAGDFAAAPSRWECPKCRHFMHCPA